MVRLGVEAFGFDEAETHLEELQVRLSDPRPALLDIYESFLRLEAKRFDNEGPGWAPLAESTLRRKEKLGYPSTILEMTGALKKSLTVAGSPGAVFEVDAAGVTMGSDLKTPDGRYGLGMLHQTGTSRMPKRPVVDTAMSGILEWSAIIREWVLHGEAGAAGAMSLSLGPSGL